MVVLSLVSSPPLHLLTSCFLSEAWAAVLVANAASLLPPPIFSCPPSTSTGESHRAVCSQWYSLSSHPPTPLPSLSWWIETSSARSVSPHTLCLCCQNHLREPHPRYVVRCSGVTQVWHYISSSCFPPSASLVWRTSREGGGGGGSSLTTVVGWNCDPHSKSGWERGGVRRWWLGWRWCRVEVFLTWQKKKTLPRLVCAQRHLGWTLDARRSKGDNLQRQAVWRPSPAFVMRRPMVEPPDNLLSHLSRARGDNWGRWRHSVAWCQSGEWADRRTTK